MTDRPGLDFSFSGLKTFAANTVAQYPGRSTDTQILRMPSKQRWWIHWQLCQRALTQTGLKRLVIAGGVSVRYMAQGKINSCVNVYALMKN